MSPNMVREFNPEQLALLRNIHAQLMGSDALERPSTPYALKGLLCELTQPEYIAPSYICEKLNLFFPDVKWTYKYRNEAEAD